MQADVVVIGAGVLGSAVAMRLAQAGRSVLVLERSIPGAEASSAAGGILSPGVEALEPGPCYELCASSLARYPSFAAEVERLSGLWVGYRGGGTLEVALEDQVAGVLAARAEELARGGSAGEVRIDVEASAAILRGSTDSNYSWSNAYYVLDTGGDATYVDPELLYQYLDDPETEPFIQQVRVGSAIHEDGVSTTSWVADASVAVHGEVYRGIEVFAGFRGSHYESVGADLRADPQSVEGWTRTPRSVGYEGFFAGMTFRF